LQYLKSDREKRCFSSYIGNTPISKHHCLCLNSCLDIPTKLKFYVKNLVTKHNLDLNCKSPLYRKIGPIATKNLHEKVVHRSKYGMLVRSGRNKMRLWLLNTCLGNPIARKPYQNTWLRNTIDNYTILSLDHWTFGPKSKIHRFYQKTLQKWLDHWTFGPK
jgi:hypothetical protein